LVREGDIDGAARWLAVNCHLRPFCGCGRYFTRSAILQKATSSGVFDSCMVQPLDASQGHAQERHMIHLLSSFTHTHTRTHTHIYTYIHSHTQHTYTHTHINTYTHTHINTHTHTHTHTHTKHTFSHANKIHTQHTRTHTHTHNPSLSHTPHIHTHTHTCTCARTRSTHSLFVTHTHSTHTHTRTHTHTLARTHTHTARNHAQLSPKILPLCAGRGCRWRATLSPCSMIILRRYMLVACVVIGQILHRRTMLTKLVLLYNLQSLHNKENTNNNSSSSDVGRRARSIELLARLIHLSEQESCQDSLFVGFENDIAALFLQDGKPEVRIRCQKRRRYVKRNIQKKPT